MWSTANRRWSISSWAACRHEPRRPPEAELKATASLARGPGTAPAAKQMGRHVGRLVAARAAGRTEPAAAFAYRHHGDLATVGRRAAVVSLNSIRLTGWFGWWFWGIAHVWYLIGFRSRVVVSFEWFWSYLTFQRGARLITGDTRRAPQPGPRSAGQ